MNAWKLVALLYAFLLGTVLVQQAHCSDPRVHEFAVAVARTEGFYIRGTVPARLHNPGDICTRLPHAYPGQTGTYRTYAVFRSDKWGWAALEAQIQRVIDGESTRYTQEMTIRQFARTYAENWRYWSQSVSRILHVEPTETLEDFFGLAPRVRTYEPISMFVQHRRDTVSDVQSVSPVLSQVRGESGWLVVPLSEWTLEEIVQ